MEITQEKPLNPWFSIWLQPRATIQQIIETNPTRWVLLLAALAGIANALDRACMKDLGDKLPLPGILLIAAIAGPIGGIIGLYLFGALLRFTGRWLGGIASSEQIRAAIAWGSVPTVWTLLIWIPELALFGDELFKSDTPRIEENEVLSALLMSFGAVELIVGVWALVVFLKCLGQVQGFSAWKALGNSLLAMLVLILPILIVVVMVFQLARMF